MIRTGIVMLIPVAVIFLALSPFALAAANPAFLLDGDPDLERALSDGDARAIIATFRVLAQEDEVRAAELIPPAYAKVENSGDTRYHVEDRYRILTAAISVLSRLKKRDAHDVLERQFKESKEWPLRALVLQAGLQCEQIDGVDWALQGLRDKAPEVVLVAARALGFSRDFLAIQPLIETMARWENPEVPEKVHHGRQAISVDTAGRVWLACRDALERLTGESLHRAQAYRGYLDAHRDTIDPKAVDLSTRKEDRTGLGLFGLELTGKNIIFILDVSGSMVSTDPLTPEQIEKLRRATGVAGANEAEEKLFEERRRIVRAKKELKTVLMGLSDDRNFNVIAYSTEVQKWKGVLVPGEKKNREAGVAFVEGLEAEGITVTDWALREALADPKVDTVYLITDGAPTHIGAQGRDLPPDARALMEQILMGTQAMNHFRGVRIFTLGFEGAEEGFLEKLSEENGGRYVRIR